MSSCHAMPLLGYLACLLLLLLLSWFIAAVLMLQVVATWGKAVRC
jgi:hypothetical protein